MSARVVNPFSLTEMRRLREAVVARPVSFRPDPEARARVCRNLWGKTSADDSKAFAARELTEQRERASEKWGFDFLREVPRSQGTGAHRYKWSRVRIGMVPAAYKMPRIVLDRVLETARATVPTVALDAPTQPQASQEASVTAEAASPLTAPIVPDAPVSPDLSSPTTTSSSSAPSPAAPAPTRQTSITDFLQCRKRSRSDQKNVEENPAKRRKSEAEASRV